MLTGESSRMSELSDALMYRMSHLVFIEKRPFCYRDFLKFEIDGKEYRTKHGTFRNHVSKLMKAGKVEREYHSGLCFYTIKGVNFGRRKSKPAVETMMMKQPMTSNHTEVSHCHCHCHHDNHAKENAAVHDNSIAPIYNIIQNVPLDRNSLHDIHMRFGVPNIWTLVSSSVDAARSQQQEQQQLRLNSISKDIALPVWNIDNLNIKTTVHKTNTVSVVVGCSYAPIALDINGIIRLSNALTRVEERLSRLVDDCSSKGINGDEYESAVIPEHSHWIVTMWHFGADASVEYTGEKFSATWGLAENALIRAYSKNMRDGKTTIRLERQEYPGKSLADAVMNKLSPLSSSSI
jgi:hypothetical protein